MNTPDVVRGCGPLDRMLAYLRYHTAHRKLKPYFPLGRCLDVGSGAFPAFLVNLQAQEKYGIEQSIPMEIIDLASDKGIQLIEHDLSRSNELPFPENFFDAVSMLAVIEHINPSGVSSLLSEIYRIIKPQGVLVLTTPAAWTDCLLRWLAACGFISRQEIEDHKDVFRQPKLKSYLAEAGFGTIKTGTFECFMNLWAVAQK